MKLVVDNTQALGTGHNGLYHRVVDSTIQPIQDFEELKLSNKGNVVWFGSELGQWISLARLSSDNYQLLWTVDSVCDVSEQYFAHPEDAIASFVALQRRMQGDEVVGHSEA